MRCAYFECGQPIGLFRRIRALEFHSEECHQANTSRRAIQRKTAVLEVGKEVFRIPLTRGVFIAFYVSIAMYSIYQVLRLKPELLALPTFAKKLNGTFEHQRTISDWTSETRQLLWTAVNDAASLKIPGNWLEPIGPVLYTAVTRVTEGIISFNILLASTGQAGFIIGSDRSARNCFLVELVSDTENIFFRGYNVRGGVRSGVSAASAPAARNNLNVHEVHIRFDSTSIAASADYASATWTNLNLPAGLVGVSAAKPGDFRIYSATMNLRT